MKLATFNDQNRDGILVVVDKTLTYAVTVPTIARTLQDALERWQEVKTKLAETYALINSEKRNSLSLISFDSTKVFAPLPRSYQWLDGSAYVNHVALARKARGVEMPQKFWEDPLMYQGGSDSFLSATDTIVVADESWGYDFEAEIAVITDDVSCGISVGDAGEHIQLLTLVNDISLRNLIPEELSKGFGFLHGKPSSAFSPVAITPDELGVDWYDSKVHLPLSVHYNAVLFGNPNAGKDMVFNFSQLIHHAAKTRSLIAGTIIGSGTVSNSDTSVGSACIVEKRMLEILRYGTPKSSYLQKGDTITIEMFDRNGFSIFGRIEQSVI